MFGAPFPSQILNGHYFLDVVDTVDGLKNYVLAARCGKDQTMFVGRSVDPSWNRTVVRTLIIPLDRFDF